MEDLKLEDKMDVYEYMTGRGDLCTNDQWSITQSPRVPPTPGPLKFAGYHDDATGPPAKWTQQSTKAHVNMLGLRGTHDYWLILSIIDQLYCAPVMYSNARIHNSSDQESKTMHGAPQWYWIIESPEPYELSMQMGIGASDCQLPSATVKFVFYNEVYVWTELNADPKLEHCPDFTSINFVASCTPLPGPTTDDAQAAVMLQTIWVATNAARKVQWQQQLEEVELQAMEQHRLLSKADEQHLAVQQLQDAATAEEDRKKNRIHHIAILDPQFVELYYWTNKGLTHVRLDFNTTDDDSMVPTAAADSSTTWTAASAACPAAGVITDHLLTPLDFSQAVPRFIASLEQHGWANQCIIMLANFFGALMLHHYWTSDNLHEQHALLAYEEEQRCTWHQAIPQPNGAWNISIIDEVKMSWVFDCVYHAEHEHADSTFDSKLWLCKAWEAFTCCALF
ncbi:hypothetical protein BDR05DRAFT_945484 [Suillus weaverae]|nr:hypothetical protein BDR05DRAFT_945484 [Suillus weaverae]